MSVLLLLVAIGFGFLVPFAFGFDVAAWFGSVISNGVFR